MVSDSIRRRVVFLNRVQRYKNILEYANFEAQKLKFFDKNLHISEKITKTGDAPQARNVISWRYDGEVLICLCPSHPSRRRHFRKIRKNRLRACVYDFFFVILHANCVPNENTAIHTECDDDVYSGDQIDCKG